MKTTYSNNQRVTAMPLRRLCTVLCCALLSMVSVWAQQENMVVLTTTDGERQISTAEVQSIRFEGGRVVLTQPWGQIVYNRTLSELTFFRPLPGMLRLSVGSTINKNQGTKRAPESDNNPGIYRALGLDELGKVKSTWEITDQVYVYPDAVTTTYIGTLMPTTTGSATATLLGDIEKAGLTNGQTLYLSTVPRPHSFAEQTGTLESLFYATAESALTISGGNAYMNDVTFNNSQSITKFTMKDGYGDDIAVKSLTITGGASPITVTPASASAEVFVAMPQTSESTEYSFTAVDTDNRTRTGTKKANVQEGKYYTADVTVKLAAVVNTAPVANTLNYNGTAQTLVTAAVATGGTLSYKLGTGTYSESIPAATDIGNYTVYYKVTGDADHHDVAEASVPVSIGRGLGSISFGTSEVNKTIYTDASYSDVVVTKVGDGPVSYTSSNQAVAQVGASSGEVTIFGVGQTTITATATSGTCYDYAEPTAQYTLTVHKAVANIGYATQTVNKTYADVNFTNSLSNSGNGTVAYSVPDANGVATVNASSGEVTIIGVGTTTVTATATDAATYTYATKVATYTLNVAPRIPTVSLSATNGSCYEGSSVSFTASVPAVNGKAYDGTLSVASSNSDVAVATIDNGAITVTAIDGGTADITVTAPATTNWAQGTATYQITVNNKITGSISYATNTENKTYGDGTFTKTLTKTGDGSVTYASGNTSVATVNSSSGLVTIVGAGTAVITATVTDGVTYTYPTNTASYTLTVNKATLTATTSNQSRTYGEANPSFTVSVTGFVKGETAGTAAGYTAPTASCAAGNSSNVGTYDITVSGGSAANYAFAYTKGTLTVSKATLTATADNKSRAYGVANPTFTVSVTGFKNNETAGTAAGYTAPTASSAATSTSNVGTYDITVSGGSATNYAFTYAKGTLTIGQAAPTYTAPTAKSLTYNGSAQALVNAGSTSHGTIQYATSQNGTYSTTVPTETNAGSYTVWYKVVGDGNHTDVAATQVTGVSISPKTVSSPTITLGTSSYTYDGSAKTPAVSSVADGSTTIPSGEYTVSYSNNTNAGTATVTITDKSGGNYTVSGTKTFTINKAAPTYTAPTAKSLTYNGSAQALVNAGSTSHGTIQFATSQTGTYSTTVPTGTAAGSYTVWYKLVGDGNHTDVTATQVTGVSISPKTVSSPTITLATTSYTYDGSAKTPAVSSVADGSTTIPSGEYTVSYSNNTNAGTATVTITDKSGGNYTVSGTKTFTINKAAPTYTAPTAKSLTYNGSAQALVNAGSTSHGTIQFATSQTGTYSTTVPTGTAAGSYTVWYKLVGDGNHTDVAATQVSGVSISKKSLSISAQAKSKTYGAADPTLTYTSDGLVGSDGITGVLTRVSGENVGTYAITQGTLSAGNNYAISYTGSNLTINKATLTATADNKSRTYGASNPSFTVSVTGFKNNETAGTAAGYTAPTASCSATSSSNAGTYDITVSGGSATNYAFTYAKGTLTINKAAPTYTAPTAKSLTYNGSAQALVNAGSTSHGTIQYATSETGTYSTTVPTGTAAGSYTVWYKLVGDGNHTDVAATQVSGVSISPKTVSSPTITLATTSYTYDGSAKTPAVSSVADGSTTISSGEYTVSYSNNTNAGTATVTITDKSGGNYTVSGTKTFTINKAAPTYTAPTAKSLTYNGSAQALVNAGSTSHGTIQFATSQTGTYSTTVPTGTAAGSYTVWYKLVGDGNHTDVTATQVTGVSISKAAGSISYGTTSVPKTYGDAAFTNTLTKSGDGSVTYASSNTSVATVNSSSGQVTIANAGSATITATVADGSNYTYATKTATYTVSVSKAAAYSVTAAPTAKTSLTYNGSGQALVNAGTVSGGTLYYQMTTSNSKPSSTSGFSSTIPSATNAGTYYVWYYVKGDGNHNDGAISTSAVAVSISPKTVSSPTITLSSSSYTYDGSVKTPTVTVKDGSTTISTSEYSVSYNNNVNVGTATVTVTDNAGGNYTVSGSTSFTINKAGAYSVTAAPTAKTSLTYNGSGQALVNAGTVSGGTLYYQMTTSNSKPSSTGGFSSSIPTGTNAGTYYVWYYVKGDGNHNDGAISTSAVAVSISPKTVSSPTITLATSSYTYDGSAKTPSVSSVADGSTTISSGEYTVSYSNNTNAGTATVTITDNSGGNYTVSGTKTFTINKAAGSISYGTTSVPKTYGDAAFTNTLTKSGDGSVTYASNNTSVATVNSSTGQVTIAGAGSATITATVTDGSNYTYATKTASYTVTVSKANPTLTLSTTNLSLTKASPTGTVTVTRSGDGVITATSSNTSVATVSVSGTTVTVTAIANGSATITVKMNEGTNHNAYTATDKTITVSSSGFYRYMSNATTDDVGKVICSNGHIHTNVSDVTCGGSASAMIAYVGNKNGNDGTSAYSSTLNHGLAIAFRDVRNSSGMMQHDASSYTIGWQNGLYGCIEYQGAKPSGVTWKMPSCYQWQRMLIACGSSGEFRQWDPYEEDDTFPLGNINNMISSCGNNSQNVYELHNYYWVDKEYSGDNTQAWYYELWRARFGYCSKTYPMYARPCFAF